MSISEISIRRPVFAWMLMTGLIVFGAVAFLRMGISQLPDVDFPVVKINVRLEGAAPEVIETEIADYIEDAVMGIEGVTNVTSRSENSECTIVVEFNLSRSIDLAVQDVQAKLSQVQSRLPREITALTVSKTNPEDQPIIAVSLESDKYPLRDLMYYVSDHLKGQFAMVPGVGDITLNGYVDPNLRIWVDEKKLERYELTVNDVISTVQLEHAEMPAGQVNDRTGERMFYVRTTGEVATVKDFENLLINTRGGKPNYTQIRLGQVARVEDGMNDILRYSRAGKVPGVGLSILKQRGTNAVAVAKAVRLKLADVQKNMPEGMRLAVNFDSTKYVEQAVSELYVTLLLSALLTAVVIWLFLGSWSSTFNVLMSIPTSVVGTFIVLYFAGFTLNTFTLLGLSLSIGIIVDDAIMVLENIIRHQEMGKDRVQAARDGATEITFAALAATLSIVAIFLPVVFMDGVIGKFFFQFGVTITAAVLLSLVEALTLTPMRCSQFADHGGRRTRLGQLRETALDGLTTAYRRALAGALDHKLAVLMASVVVCAVSLGAIGFLNKEFLPAEDQSRFNIRLKTPIGTSLLASSKRFAAVEDFLSKRPEVDRYVLAVGGGSPGDANGGSVLVTMKEKGHRGIDPAAGHELSQQEFMEVCRTELKKLGGFRAMIQDLSTKSFTASRGFPVEFTIKGPDWEKLAEYSKVLNGELEKSGIVTDIDADYEAAMPEFHVVPDRERAAQRGVSVQTIGETVNALIGGVLVGRYPKGGHRYDIRVKLEESAEDPAKKMERLSLRNNRGELVALSNLVRVEEKTSMSEINRVQRERAITVYANVKKGASQQAALDLVQATAKRILPVPYRVELSGSSSTFGDSFRGLIVALALGLFVAYLVLASQFNSFVDPFTVLLALPFSLSGAFLALWVAHQSLNIYSMIGLILLMGIVKKNSILLVDFANRVKEDEGKGVRAALLVACPTRLRPIVMTSIATIAGAVPAAISFGPGAESRVPMAVAIIGGVIVSTVLTLFVVPCAYQLFSREKK